ncbi:ribonuclease P protein subunit p25 [Talpa occidentalis]|uniref:ribonuclease P protein subunit p25 n=1 Tax=Talpa occidentalis TaxID=50954 RepID=UPI001890B511|nr:ribonuclease P protein subunit p25 [Talpa occidentalis]
MENFRKVRSEEAPAGGGPGGDGPFADLAPGAVHMRVKEGSKIRNLLAFATASMAQPATRAIVFSGCGRASTKAVTCAEILKRRLAGLHQVTRLRYRGVREEWQSRPPGPAPGPAASLSVLKNVPGLAILLSKDALDPRQPGYQPPSPLPGPSAPPAAPTAKRRRGDPAAGEGAAKRARPQPDPAPEDRAR